MVTMSNLIKIIIIQKRWLCIIYYSLFNDKKKSLIFLLKKVIDRGLKNDL